MSRSAWPIVALLGLVSGLAAQGGDGGRDNAEWSRTQRELQQNRSEVDRLIDLRLRHDLGLPGEGDQEYFRSQEPATTDAIERARQELRDQDTATATLLERYNKLKLAVEQLRAEAAVHAETSRQEQQFVVVPRAGAAQPVQPIGAPTAPGPVASSPTPPPPKDPNASSDSMLAAAIALDKVRGQIHGSDDHQRVAQSLFKAGQALMDRAAIARDQAQDDLAAQLDERAKERPQRAVAELEPLLQPKDPPFAALFYLGRCRELLFRLAERHEGLSLAKSPKEFSAREQDVRQPFLAISARDVTRKGQRGEIEVLGPWGLAAQTAMEHFRWMNLNSGYDPRPAIEALTWPGEQNQ